MHWNLLGIDFAVEFAATASLKFSDGITKLGFAALTLLCFGLAFYMILLVVRTMPLGITYSALA